MIETDCEVDFAPPLDYVEPSRDEYAAASAAAAAAAAMPPPEASASAPGAEVAWLGCWLKFLSAQAAIGDGSCLPHGLQPHVLPPRGCCVSDCKAACTRRFNVETVLVRQMLWTIGPMRSDRLLSRLCMRCIAEPCFVECHRRVYQRVRTTCCRELSLRAGGIGIR